MRLIDADALKKCAIPCQIHNGALTDLCVPLYQIDNAPTVEPDMEFAKWVTEMIFGNNEVEDFDFDIDFELFSELACRKLEKLGLVKKTESEWIKKDGA